MKSPPLKVGFDLDGVLLYNPVRIVRPILKATKSVLLHQKKPSFFIPKPGWQELMWQVVHKSSMFQAPGLSEINSLVKNKTITAYIITARFKCLEKDYYHWIKKLNANHTFKACYANFSNSQPHLYKEAMVKKLDLDIFVDDNWDIVTHLNQSLAKQNPPPQILWITNILDRSIKYSHKHTSLHSVVKDINQYKKEK